MTRFGPLDLLGSIGKGSEYENLIGHTDEMDLGAGVKAQVLKLELLIQLKEETAGEKDRAVLPILRRTLEEKSR